jgi:hypothetical protein
MARNRQGRDVVVTLRKFMFLHKTAVWQIGISPSADVVLKKWNIEGGRWGAPFRP